VRCDEAESAPLKGKVSTPHDPRCECYVLQQQPNVVHSSNSDDSSTKGEPTSPDVSANGEPLQGEYDRERQQACLDELDEAQKALEDEQARLHHTLGAEAASTPVHGHAQEVRRCIVSDVHGTLVAKRTSHNLTATVVLLRAGPKPTTPEEKKLR
jgi:hypothetical protein